MLRDKLFQLFSIRRGLNLVTRLRTYGLPEFPQQRLVLRQRNGAGSVLMGFRHRRLPWCHCFLLDPGQRYTETRAFPGFAFNLNLAVTLFDESIYGGEAESGSLANVFSRKKGFENTRSRLRVHSYTCV